MGKQLDATITTALNNIASAIREHTAHVKEDDRRYWDDQHAYKKEDTEMMSDYRRAYIGAVNAFRRSQAARYEESSREFPDFVQKVMQERPHMFTRPTRVSGLTVDVHVPNPDCRICGLKSGNPVHLIQIAELSFRED